VRPVEVVAVKPAGEPRSTFGGAPIGLVVCPLAQERLDEAFGYTVRAPGVGAGAQMVRAQRRHTLP